jgi:rubrerythrin
MTVAAPTTTLGLTPQQLALMLQYTVEAYKVFEKFAENLPNPMTRTMFKQFAIDERENRDLIEMKNASTGGNRVRVTLGADMIFNELLEGELSYRETCEFLISRERTMQRKMREFLASAGSTDRKLLLYFESVKKSHMVELERELELIREDADWWKREDAEWHMINGTPVGA